MNYLKNNTKSEIENLSELGQFSFNNTIKLIDLKISSRNCNYWRNERLLPFISEHKMVKINIIEACWLMIINTLSDMGFSTSNMLNLTNELFYKPFNERYADKKILESVESISFDNRNSKAVAEMRNFLNDNIGMQQIRKDINPFSSFIMQMIYKKEKGCILIDKEGNYSFFFLNEKNVKDFIDAISSTTKIVIPIHELLKKLIAIEIVQSDSELKYLSQIENEIVKIIRTDNWTEVKIYDRKKDYYLIIDNGKTMPATEFADLILKNKISESTHFEVTSKAFGQVQFITQKKYVTKKLPVKHRSN